MIERPSDFTISAGMVAGGVALVVMGGAGYDTFVYSLEQRSNFIQQVVADNSEDSYENVIHRLGEYRLITSQAVLETGSLDPLKGLDVKQLQKDRVVEKAVADYDRSKLLRTKGGEITTAGAFWVTAIIGGLGLGEFLYRRSIVRSAA